MRICVISPKSRQGRTTAAILLGQALARTTSLDVTLTHMGLGSSMAKYLGFEDLVTDSTRSISQLARVVERGNLTPGDIKDFAIMVEPNVSFLSTHAPSTKVKDGLIVVKGLYEFENYSGVTIVDVATEIYEESTQYIINNSDMVLIATDQTNGSLEAFQQIMESEYAPPKNKVGIIITNFDPVVCSLREALKAYGVPRKKGTKISYNPYLVKESNKGHFSILAHRAHQDELRYAQLRVDILELAKLLGANLGFNPKWSEI